jgi:hypothetical protein
MGRKEDDIFRKLNKQTPMIKRKDISPLSSGSSRSPQRAEPLRYAAISPKPASRNPSERGADLANRYNQRQTPNAPRQGLTIFGEEESVPETRQPAKKPVVKTTTPPAPRVSARAAQDEPKRVEQDGGPRSRSACGESRTQRTGSSKTDIKRSAVQDTLEVYPSSRTEPVKREGESGVPRRREMGTAASKRTYGQASPARQADDRMTELAQETADNGLSFRHELKYYINYHDYVLLKSTLKSLLALDSNAGEDGDYHIRSLYFDDIYETALAQKMAGYDTRNKYRIRIYDFSDNVIKFEKKMKRGQYIAKSSILISRDDCDALIAGNYSCLEGRREPLAEEIFLQMKNNLLRPRVIVDYHREAYVSPFENVRITFDKDLKAGLWLTDIFNPNAPTMSMLEPGTMVLEVKFNKYLPPFIKSVLNNVNAAQRSAVSKYVLCRKYE